MILCIYFQGSHCCLFKSRLLKREFYRILIVLRRRPGLSETIANVTNSKMWHTFVAFVSAQLRLMFIPLKNNDIIKPERLFGLMKVTLSKEVIGHCVRGKTVWILTCDKTELNIVCERRLLQEMFTGRKTVILITDELQLYSHIKPVHRA